MVRSVFIKEMQNPYKVITQTKETPKKKTSLLLTPWLVGVKKKTSVEVEQETKNEYYTGQLYITNMRMVFKCQDIVLLCSNCHSVVHRKQPWLRMSELEAILRVG